MPCSSVVPSLEEVFARLPAWQERPNCLESEQEYKHAVLRDLSDLRHSLIEAVRGGGTWWGWLLRLFHAWWNQDELLRTLQALRQIQRMSLADSRFYELLRSNIDAVTEQQLTMSTGQRSQQTWGARGDYVLLDSLATTTSVSDPVLMHHSSAVTSLVDIMVFMLFLAVPARLAPGTAKGRQGIDRSYAAHMAELMVLQLCKAAPAGGSPLRSHQEWLQHLKCQNTAEAVDGTCLDGIRVDASWLHDGALFAMIGYKDFAWAIGMKELIGFNGGGSQEMKLLSATEHVLMYSLRSLLCTLVAELEVQANWVTSLQMQALGMFVSIMTAALTYLTGRRPKADGKSRLFMAGTAA